MDRRRSPAGCPRGGARIPSLRPARARLITGAGALASLAAAGGYAAIAETGRLAELAGAAGVVGVVLLAAAVVGRWPSLIPWAILATGSGYLIGREGRAVVDGWAAVVGVALLLSAELAAWSIEHDARIRTERRLLARRIITLAGLTVAALLANFLLLAAAALSAPAGVLLAAAGVGSAVLAVGVVLRLLR
jgi:hypothetical protein